MEKFTAMDVDVVVDVNDRLGQAVYAHAHAHCARMSTRPHDAYVFLPSLYTRTRTRTRTRTHLPTNAVSQNRRLCARKSGPSKFNKAVLSV
jgi:hypothetical protein